MTPEPHRLRELVTEQDWTRGPAGAPVTLVEYLDFHCPFCQRAFPVIEEVLAELESEVLFAVRHFPVPSAHEHAEAAALAAEAAGRQGKFWEMYRRLFEAQGRLAPDNLLRYAEELGLDLDHFRRDMADAELLEKVRRQKHIGLRSGVNGTPTLYINGLRWDGEVEAVALRQALEEAREAAR